MKKALVLYTFVLVLGIISYFNVPVHLFPVYQDNKVFVTVSIPGMTPSVIHHNYGLALKHDIESWDRVQSIYSKYSENSVRYEINARDVDDVDALHTHIQESLSKMPALPSYAPPVQVDSLKKSNLAKLATVHLQDMSDRQREFHDTRYVIEHLIFPLLRRINGISIRTDEPLHNTATVSIDRNTLIEHGLSFAEVSDILSNSTDFNLGAMTTAGIDASAEFQGSRNPEELLDTIISHNNNEILYLQDVAELTIDTQQQSFYSHYNSKPSFSIKLYLNREHSTVNASQQLEELVNELNVSTLASLNYNLLIEPAGVSVVSPAIMKMVISLLIGLILTVIVLVLFRIPGTLIGLTFGAIPFSLSVTVISMWYFGISFNVYSLAALAFTIGAVLDAPILWFYLRGERSKHLLYALLFSTLTSIGAIVPFIVDSSPAFIAISQMAVIFVVMLTASLVYTVLFYVFSIQTQSLASLDQTGKRTLEGSKPGLLYTVIILAMIGCVSSITLGKYIFNPSYIKTGSTMFFVESPFEYNEHKQNQVLSRLDEAAEAFKQKYTESSLEYQSFSNPVNGTGVKFIVRDLDVMEEVANQFPEYMSQHGFNVYNQRDQFYSQPQKLLEAYIHYPYREGELTLEKLHSLRQQLATEESISMIQFTPGEQNVFHKVTLKPNQDAISKTDLSTVEVQRVIRGLSIGTYLQTYNQDGLIYHLFLKSGTNLSSTLLKTTLIDGDNPTLLSDLLLSQLSLNFSEQLNDNGRPVLRIKLVLSDDYTVTEFIDTWDKKIKPKLVSAKPLSGDPTLTQETFANADDESTILLYSLFSVGIVLGLLLIYFDSGLKLAISLISIVLSIGLLFALIIGVSSLFGMRINSILVAPILMVAGISVNTCIIILGSGKQFSYDLVYERTVTRLKPLLITIVTTIAGSLPLLFIVSNVTSAYNLSVIVLSAGVVVSSMAMLYLLHVFGKVFK